MAAKRSQTDGLADELYGLPLAEFTPRRNEVAAELRREGRRDEADQVKALPKPTAAAWAVNQLALRHRSDLDAYFAAVVALRDAQLGQGEDIAEATRRQRGALELLVSTAKNDLGGSGSTSTLAKVRQTLEAAAVDDDAAELVTAARLARELEPAGFGTLDAHVSSRRLRLVPAAATPRPPAEPRPDRARIRRAEAKLGRAEARSAEAREALERAQQAVDEADAAVAAARSELERARGES